MFRRNWKGNCNRRRGHRERMSRPICWKAPVCVCGPMSCRKRRRLSCTPSTRLLPRKPGSNAMRCWRSRPQRELTEEEQATLADLIDAVEIANAERWQAIAALARLRGLSVAEVVRDLPSEVRPCRQFGCGRHLLSGAGVDVDALMAVPIDEMFADYVPEDKE